MPEWYTFATLVLGLFDKVLPLFESLVGAGGNQPAHLQQLAGLKDAHAALSAAVSGSAPAPVATQ